MNLTAVFLGIVIVVLIFILYKYMYPTNTVLQATATLNTGAIPPITSIINANSQRYALSLWIYMNSWDNTTVKTIYSRMNSTTNPPITYYSLTLDRTAPILYFNIGMNDGTTQNMVITNNFPIQKWVCVLISVDNQFVDAYLDGKLVKSQRAYIPADLSPSNNAVMPATQPPATVPIQVGSAIPVDAYVSQFTRWDTPIDPQTAWTIYLQGNGQSGIMGGFNNFGAELNILKNNLAYSKITLF
jgi:hypothetical protein